MKFFIASFGLIAVLLAAVCLVDAQENNMTTAAPTTTAAATTSGTTAAPNTTLAATTEEATTVAPTPTQPPDDTFRVQNKDNATCLIAKFGIDFKITYMTKSNTTATANIALPLTTEVDQAKSMCGENSSKLALTVPDSAFNFTLEFVKDKTSYYANMTTLDYTLDDEHFPNATNPGQVVTAVSTQHLFEAALTMSYSCRSDQIYNFTSGNVGMLTHDVHIQAFDVKNNNFSEADVCAADTPSTSSPVTTASVTTAAPTPPPYGNWTVKDSNSTVCMIMKLAIRFNITYLDKNNKTLFSVIDVDPTQVDTSNSNCENHSSSNFVLIFTNWDGWNMSMKFDKTQSDKYAMDKVTLNYKYDDKFPNSSQEGMAVTSQSNTTQLSVSVGYSYKCDNEQDYHLDNNTMVMLRDVLLQPFARDAKDGGIGAAEDCEADQTTSNIVPIAVGCALAGLVIIVLIAYLIGRRRSHAKGYQSV